MIKRCMGWAVAFCMAALGAGAQAADIKVLTAGAMKSVVVALAPEFQKQTGHTLLIDNDTAGGLLRRRYFAIIVCRSGNRDQIPFLNCISLC